MYKFVQAKHYRKGRIKPIQLIVIHSMEAPEKGETAENVANYFSNATVEASAHLCVDNNSIIQCVRFDDTAFHCKNANANGIGIEHAGYAKQTTAEWLDDYGKKMLELSAKAAADLCKQFSIPIQKAQFLSKDNPTVVSPGLCGHAEVPQHGSHTDPGKFFPWTYYLGLIKYYFDQIQTK